MGTKSSSFLASTASNICQHLQGDLSNCLILLPSSLGAEVFRDLVTNGADSHMPPSLQVSHLDAWVVQQSGLQVASHLELLTILYACWKRIKHDGNESFEQFYGWGSMLLQDFDAIDKYLVNADQLFQNLYEQKKFKPTFTQLASEEKKAIESFWNTFQTKLSPDQKDFLAFWKLLAELYGEFSAALLAQQKGYTGLCYKRVCLKLTPKMIGEVKQIAVIGFNELNPATDKIFRWMNGQVSTSFYWDLDASYMQDDRQEAGYHLRSNQQKGYLEASFPQPYPICMDSIPKKITICECHTAISQGKQIAEVLEPVWENFAALEPQELGIILADKTLLVPLLQALAIPYPSIYATIGYPLTNTMAYQLMTQLLALQVTIHPSTGPAHHLPTSKVIQFLAHPFIQSFDPEGAKQTLAMLQKGGANSVPQELLAQVNTLYQTLFQAITSSTGILDYLVSVADLILEHREEWVSDNDRLEEQALILLQDKIKELQQHPEVFNGLSVGDVKRLFYTLTQGIEVPFSSSSPHTARVFIVGIAETIGLDFQKVYILGMNEGSWPSKNGMGSFIPYNIRKGYGLPTHNTLQASVDAYYFYRLLPRAQEVYITYSNAISGGQKSEMSRYIWQLLYESQLPIEQATLAPTIVNSPIPPIIIQKDESIMAVLANYLLTPLSTTTRTFTPSALNTYIDCSLRFYFKYVLNLSGTNKLLPDQTTDAIQFGTILHKVLEQIYQKLLRKKSRVMVQKKDILRLKSQVKQVLTDTLNTYIYQSCSQEVWLIEQAVIEKVVDRILDLDAAYAPFQLLGIEVGYKGSLVTSFRLKNGKTILLGGIIDRVDESRGIIRAIDYKTGNDSTAAASIDSLFEQRTVRNKGFLQVLLYAWLLQRQPQYQALAVMPIFMNIKDIFQPDFDPRLRLTQKTKGVKSEGNGDDLYVTDITHHLSSFESCLDDVFTALLNPDVPFVQTEQLLICNTCPYNRICQRMG